MNDKIKDIFNAESLSILNALGKPGSAYQVPSYQRTYSWKQENISRLIEDVTYGIKDLSEDPKTLSFIGTFIVTPLTSSSEMPSDPLSIVDGQQRLTTIVLIIALLHEKIRIASLNIGLESKIPGFNKEVRKILQNLKSCLFDDHKMSDDEYDLQPVITRDYDIWGNDKFSCNYESSVSNLLYQYAVHLHPNKTQEFKFELKGSTKEIQELNERIQYIESTLTKTHTLDSEHENLYLGDVVDLLDNSIKKKLFTYINNKTEYKVDGLDNKEQKVIFLTIFSRYLIEKVVLTKVMASEKYAFDVFESLNTTGEPLTALETFKPKLIQLINEINNSKKAYDVSKCKNYLSEVEKYIEKSGEQRKQGVTQDIVNNFALLYSGDILGKSLSAQRNYLRYQVSNISSEDEATLLVSKLTELITFKTNIWSAEELENQLRNESDRDVVLTCCEFLRCAKKTLTIPILTRYYSNAKLTSNFQEFSNVVKAITAFTMIWRTAFGGTNSIDNVYREVMYYGYKKKRKIDAPEIKKPVCYANEVLPSSEELCSILQNHLKSKNILLFEEWYKHSKHTNVYGASGPIAKMFLLMANHKSIWSKEDKLLSKDARNNVREYLNLDVWNSQRSYSIEHIAPQKRNKRSTWDNNIYKEVNTVNTIGNLTLLPQKENDAVANSNWDTKLVYFNCFVQRDNKELESAIEKAKEKGLTISNKIIRELLIGDYLDILEPIILQGTWKKNDINQRTENLCLLLWRECENWLKLTA